MQYSVSEIIKIINGTLISRDDSESLITHIIYDTRKVSHQSTALFIALKGTNNDGHTYISDAVAKGIKNILVNQKNRTQAIEGINIIEVDNTMLALHQLARYHRAQYNCPVIGITGSNGKTTVKEWLSQALSSKMDILKSPQSYNSQLGVALSLLMMKSDHQTGIIEAGISKKGEMQKLQNIIQPDVGILTNIGDAHSHGFSSMEEKLNEKLLLFQSCDSIIYNNDNSLIEKAMQSYKNKTLVSWGHQIESTIRIVSTERMSDNTLLVLNYDDENIKIKVPFLQEEIIKNSLSVITYLLHIGWSQDEIENKLSNLRSLSNRLELKEGKNNCTLINDSYSADLASVRLALEYQEQHAYGKKKIVIISRFQDQSGNHRIYRELKELLVEKEIDKVLTIDFPVDARDIFLEMDIHHYSSVHACITTHPFSQLKDACILIKGATKYKLEEFYNYLSKQVHQTILETDYNAVVHNLNVYKSYLPDATKVMTILKAEAYGSGSVALAQYLSDKGIDYLGVAIIDEAIIIREAGIKLPIMIFNVQENNLDLLFRNALEPEVYSFRLLDLIVREAENRKENIDIHIKVDTGMHRLGFSEEDIDQLILQIQRCKYINVVSILSHLSASDTASQDTFTENQISLFEKLSDKISAGLSYKPMLHILNTGGIIRHNHAAYDMVRLGLGLYGIDSTKIIQDRLQRVHSLKAKILQIKKLKKGESTGYNRSGIATEDMTIAVISIGYADGLMRMAGHGKFFPRVHGLECPTIGSVCMDVTMIDISHNPDAREGDTVELFSPELPIEKLAESCNTISYEILSRIAPRVKRTYIYN